MDEFDRYRAEMNERLLGSGHLGIKRFFALDTQAYREGALGGACAARRAALAGANARVLKVKVTRDGDVYVDGQLKTLGEAEAELGRLKRERGAVLYYREENAQHQPHPNALKIIHRVEEL